MPHRFRQLPRFTAIAALAFALLVALLLATGVSDVASSQPPIVPKALTDPTTTSTDPTTTSTDPTTTSTTDLATTSPVVQTTTYPDPYDPGYSTISELVKDTTFIVVGTLQDPVTAPSANGGTVAIYPIDVQQDVGTYAPRMAIGVSSAEFNAGNLSVNGTYIFFWASDSVDQTQCIVGGARGMFACDAAADTVARLDDNSQSQIPQTQSLEQFSEAVAAAQAQYQAQPLTNLPPMCTPSATGIDE
jgi:hypothetical protein